MNLAQVPPEARRNLRLSEYHRMIEAGVFDEDERLELLGGVLVRMSPHGTEHARAIQHLTHLLVRACGHGHVVRVQLPLTLAGDSEPEPDLAVVSAAEAEADDRHPRTAALVIEVAGDSLATDRAVKGPIYAAAAITEYWLVNLAERSIEVYRDPAPAAARYQTAFTRTLDQELSPSFAPGVVIRVHEILG